MGSGDCRTRRPVIRLLSMNKLLVLIAELALVISGVFIFRGLWTLLDAVPFMQSALALWLSLAAGVAVTIWALWCIQRNSGG